MTQQLKAFELLWLAGKLNGVLVMPGETAECVAARLIRGGAGLAEAGPEEITFIDEAGKVGAAEASRAGAVIVPMSVEKLNKPMIRVPNPRLAFAEVLGLFVPPAGVAAGVHPTAIIGAGAKLGKDVAMGAYAVIGEGAQIGDGAMIYPQVYIGNDVSIGEQTAIWPQTVVGWGTQIGAHCILYSGVVIGADGFGYIWDGEQHRKVPQIGRVVIEDDVEIGANTTIDRATTNITRIGRGTKIDNQVHIAHNVIIGEHCIIAGKVGISGSVTLGKRVILAGQVGVVDHVKIGDDAKVLARAAVFSDLPAGSVSSGIPAYPHREYLKVEAATRKLPEMLREIRELKQRLERQKDEG